MFTLLPLIITLCTILTYIIPAGQYDTYVDENVVEMLVDGSYHRIEQTPVTPMQTLMSVQEGLIETACISAFIFIIGGAFGNIYGILNSGGTLPNIIPDYASLRYYIRCDPEWKTQWKDSDHLFFLGIRSIESDELDFYRNNKINVRSAADIDRQGVPKVLEQVVGHMKQYGKVYLTLDIDCLDPAYAAGTGTPQFGGLTARQLLDLLEGLFDGLNIIGMDVVEVAPKLDPSLAALFAARKIVTECWAHHYFKHLR